MYAPPAWQEEEEGEKGRSSWRDGCDGGLHPAENICWQITTIRACLLPPALAAWGGRFPPPPGVWAAPAERQNGPGSLCSLSWLLCAFVFCRADGICPAKRKW